MRFKLSKVKGGKVSLFKEINKLNKMTGRGTPAVKELTTSEISEIERDELKGKGISRRLNKSIKPLQFKF